ncbi:MAG: hypothetical protein UX37_C0002G0032 [Microgenomates group bacterium GW2011_GWA2_46_16]|nr:MAG: hypothetical protein UX37_C0002G0032 [Microgenomates group bacterium GW2011_GWA2_46_16]
MKKILSWLDRNILTLLTGILIVVIPLYPKLPLSDLIEGYIVRLRLEDILILFTCVIWGVQLLRRKIQLPKTSISKLIYFYLGIGVLSSLSAIFITHTVPLFPEHLFKLALHLFRRFEYFSLFFIAYSAVKNKQDLVRLLTVGFVTLVAVVLYGFGQKYLYWPAFSTMNREFSKGLRLYLSPSSRVMSTFGGHYDYGAYLMMLLSPLIAALWLIKNKLIKILLSLVALGAYWSLILTASRTSFIGFLIGITTIALALIKSQGWKWCWRRWSTTMVVSLLIMTFFGDLSERFYQVINSAEKIHQFMPWIETGKIEEKIFEVKDYGYRLQAWQRNLFNPPKPTPPPNSISTDELAQVAVSSDIPPSPVKPLPPDVTQEEDDNRTRLSTPSAAASTPEPNGYSPNALRYGLSVAIRLDALWPRAIAGFKKNPLLGSGYSTLTKSFNDEFTQAESTDNDYLRMLGETGLLGTISFLAILLTLISLINKKLRSSASSPLNQIIYLGVIGAIVGLLVNATYIDVFESSKVAYTLWLLAALVSRAIEIEDHHVEKT